MQPLDQLSDAALARVRGVFADIDDTLTTDGRLTAEAYAAMAALHEAGFGVVPITGRPAGWCDHIARMWPVDAVVGENGAFYFAYDAASRKLVKRFRDDEATRAANRARLAAVRDRILAEAPGAALASDQLYREADLAIDYCEDVPRLGSAAVDRIVAIMREAGMTAKVSSIHVNGWFGAYDKLGMTRTLVRERHGVDLDAERDRYLFVGDSPNDAPLFGYFPLSVGVANVRRFAARLEYAPAYVTARESGAGFAELAARLLAARRA
ncbi:MAG: HAD-IIB family hydrolase [Burkholderiales bacterium]|nr:HAD-IIB family hydrolase [Burkholderiales bacterium]